MPLTSGYKKAGWAAVILLVTIAGTVVTTVVWLVGPPTWRGLLVPIALAVLLTAFGPALGRWAGASVRRTLLLASAAFVATFCVEAVRNGLPVWDWRGFAVPVVMSLLQTFAVLVILAVASLLRAPAHRGPAIADNDRADGGQEAKESP